MQLLLPRDVGVADLGAVAVFSVSYGFARSAPVPAAGEGLPPTPHFQGGWVEGRIFVVEGDRMDDLTVGQLGRG